MGSFQGQAAPGLESLEQECWQIMAAAAKSREAGMHQMAVATVRNGLPEMRMVVLRGVSPSAQTLYFHTDQRKALVADLSREGFAGLLLYDKHNRTQIRLGAKTIIHHEDELCRQRWETTAHYSRRCYIQPGVSGTPAAAPWLPDALQDFSYTPEESEDGFNQFVVVECRVEWMDVYLTYHTGNQRARYTYQDGLLKEATWLHA